MNTQILDFVLLLGFAVGVTTVVTGGTIFDWLRRLYDPLFGCALCLGTWVGMGFRLAYLLAPTSSIALNLFGASGVWCLLDIIGFGALTGTLALFAHLALSALDSAAVYFDVAVEVGKKNLEE